MNYKFSQETRETLFRAKQIIIDEIDCYKKRSDYYKNAQKVVADLTRMIEETENK